MTDHEHAVISSWQRKPYHYRWQRHRPVRRVTYPDGRWFEICVCGAIRASYQRRWFKGVQEP